MLTLDAAAHNTNAMGCDGGPAGPLRARLTAVAPTKRALTGSYYLVFVPRRPECHPDRVLPSDFVIDPDSFQAYNLSGEDVTDQYSMIAGTTIN